jgi:hypothetical protein
MLKLSSLPREYVHDHEPTKPLPKNESNILNEHTMPAAEAAASVS